MHGSKRDVIIVRLTANVSHAYLDEVSLEVESFVVVILCTAWVRQYGLVGNVGVVSCCRTPQMTCRPDMYRPGAKRLRM